MSSFTDYLENAALNHIFRNVAMTSPGAVYIALFTVAPTDAGGGTEVTGSGYARQAVTFGAAVGGAIANTGAVSFTASGARPRSRPPRALPRRPASHATARHLSRGRARSQQTAR